MTEVYALELGYGFVPTPNNKDKEEEFLILEGLRFLDRLGKVDSKISDNNNTVPVRSNNTTYNHITNEREANIFIRDKSLPMKLKFSQPKELKPSHTITKAVAK